MDHRNAGRPVIQDRSSDHRFERLHLTPASVRRASGFVLTGNPECAGLNRHVVGDERAPTGKEVANPSCVLRKNSVWLRRDVHFALPNLRNSQLKVVVAQEAPVVVGF
jgi:hypothetical protein